MYVFIFLCMNNKCMFYTWVEVIEVFFKRMGVHFILYLFIYFYNSFYDYVYCNQIQEPNKMSKDILVIKSVNSECIIKSLCKT